MSNEIEMQVSAKEQERANRSAEADEMEEIKSAKWFRIWMSVWWLGAGAVFIFYLYQIATQHIDSVAHPSSTVIIDDQQRMRLPRVVVCNWNQNGDTANPVPEDPNCCPELLLFQEDCQFVNNGDFVECTNEWKHSPIQTPQGLFDCWEWNYDPEAPKFSSTTGYGGGYATVWKVYRLPESAPPQNRLGLQVSFLNNDGKEISPVTIYNEYRFAQQGQDTFFSLQLINTVHEDYSDKTREDYNVTNYDTVASATDLLVNNSADPAVAYIGVSFSFQTLSRQTIIFDVAYTINNLFGDFAGMIGTLMGIDVIKVTSSLPLMFLAVKYRTIGALADHYNG